ncbi:MAG: UDP-N-acetylmuramate dehydrogenase [Candidatus Omnitrophica bacterium]|nr:UDP-N-acetylmuramate dehydrogenase [Candidatus Omnitrophota bacterium]
MSPDSALVDGFGRRKPHHQPLAGELMAATGGRVRFNEPMRLHTTFHIGGPAEIWAEPANRQELRQLLELAREAELKVTVVGGGANLLVGDDGIPGLVVHLGSAGFQGYERRDGGILAGAGLPLEWLIRRCRQEALSGAEFLAGVPGRVGGAVRMNAGTHDDEGRVHSFSDLVRSITLMDLSGQVQSLSRDQIPFAYRRSGLEGGIVLEAALGLVPDDPDAIEERVKRLWAFKRRTQDWSAPSVGCIFKNPANAQAAGWLIDRAGLKGHRVGGAMISPTHANFIMNVGDAKAADVFALIEEVRGRVRKLFQVELDLEVQVLPNPDGVRHRGA